MSEAQTEDQPLLPVEEVEATPVYPIIHMIKKDVMHFIDTPLSYEAMTSPDLTYTLVLPLEEKYTALQRDGNKSIVFCILLNRVHFVRDRSITTSSLSRSRAALCEILAIRILRNHGSSMLELTRALTTSWPVYSGADQRIIAMAKDDGDDLEDRVGNGIEMAILGRAKRFIGSSSFQKVINGIWTGGCVYQAESSHSILTDTYKRTPVHFYDARKAPLLDHYRLKVPAIRSVLEYLNFIILFILFLLAIELNEVDRINMAELVFLVYTLGFTLEKFAAMQEHGIRVYFTGTWNGFDLALIATYSIYAFLRIYGVYNQNSWARELGIDSLALIACLIFPRLAFVTLKNNLMVLSLRAMMMQFMFLMLIAAWCFGGFLYALWILSRTGPRYSAGTIAWWMLDLWFGLDASGFDRATRFHPYFGPVLMVTYACLSNTLLLTVLVSILSHTFSTINEDAAAEAMFRKAVSTIEGVKADSLFSYQPPINLLALLILLPANYVLSPRWFHKVNVFMIRTSNFPILLLIAWYERSRQINGTSGFYETMTAAADTVFETLPRGFRKRMTIFEGLVGSENDIDAIFKYEDELDSMLGTADHPGHLQREVSSHATGARSPIKSSGQPTSPRRPTAGDAPDPSSPGISATPPRHRKTSLVSRSAEAAHGIMSPLAQIFHPLVVDDEISEAPHDAGASTSYGAGISFGPATRRRLTSMHKRSTQDPASGATPAQSTGVAFRKHPTPQSDGMEDIQLSESPALVSTAEQEPEKKIRSATQTEEEEEMEGGMPPGLSRKLADMERRQIRIEELLLKVWEAR